MFNEEDCIDYIRRHIDPAVSALYDDDELLNIVDMVFDYYEQNGMLDPDFDDEDDTQSAEDLAATLVEYATRMLRRDKGATLSPDHLPQIIEAELKYEESLV